MTEREGDHDRRSNGGGEPPAEPGERPRQEPGERPRRVSGERPPHASDPPPGRRLDRAPGERLQASAATSSPATRKPPSGPARVALVGVVVLGAIALLAVLGSFDLGPGMLAAAAFVGWAVGLAVVWATAGSGSAPSARMAMAATAAIVAVLGGYLALWGWARVEGGVLDPVAYIDARFGLLSVLLLLVAVGAAALRAR